MSRPTNDVTELARERNRQAAERTLTAWLNTSLLLVGFGIGIKEIPVALQQPLPQNDLATSLNLTELLSLGTIALSVGVLVPVVVVHQQSLKALEQDDYLEYRTGLSLSLTIVALVMVGGVALVNMLLMLFQK